MKIKTSCTAIILILLACIGSARADEAKSGKGLVNPLFVLGNGVQCEKYPRPDSQAAVLAELGYDGIGPSGCNGIPEMIRAMEAKRLKLVAQYIGVNLDPAKPTYDPKLKDAIRAMKGHGTFVWLYILRGKHKPSSEEADEQVVKIVREIAQMADESGVRVALYPHAGFYVARVEDAVRVADKVDRPNVGVTFNLCHWLKLDEPKNMRRLMELARPRLFLVTINGADAIEGSDRPWNRLIQPLGNGSFDVCGFLGTLKELGYTGPVGLQCYAVPGDKYENLKRSIAAWRKYSDKLAATTK